MFNGLFKLFCSGGGEPHSPQKKDNQQKNQTKNHF